VAAPYYVPSRAFGANDRLVMGFIGVGGMGYGHFRSYLGSDVCDIAGVCDVYEPHRARAQKDAGDKCTAYTDHRELLDRADIDAVVVATPDHWHTLVSIHACQAGKDVYCEKPLTLFITEGQELIKAVRRYGRVFQTGSQQRSSGEFRQAVELVRNGYIGKLQAVKVGIGGSPSCGWEPNQDPPAGLDWNQWLGPAPVAPYTPRRCLGSFRWFWDYSGGMMTDWGHHMNDIAQWGLGADGTGPVEIDGWGKSPAEGIFETFTDFEMKYTYASGIVSNCSNRHRGGVTFEGSDGTVFVTRGELETDPPELRNLELKPDDLHLPRPRGGHKGNWLECLKTRERPICDVEIGHRSVSVCHLGNLSARLGRKLKWDPVKELFVGDDEANRWLSRPYRAPWHL